MILATAVLAGGVGAGCGGDDDDGSAGDVSTGLAANKLLSDVTAAEAATACENLQEAFDARFDEDKLVRAFCTLFAAALADTKADCETQRDACIDQAADGEGVGAQAAGPVGPPECNANADLSECEGTVGELETCMNDGLDQISALLDGFSCDDAATVTQESIEEMDVDFEPPASCANVQCADDALFGEDE
jgi:hypothetical protein